MSHDHPPILPSLPHRRRDHMNSRPYISDHAIDRFAERLVVATPDPFARHTMIRRLQDAWLSGARYMAGSHSDGRRWERRLCRAYDRAFVLAGQTGRNGRTVIKTVITTDQAWETVGGHRKLETLIA